MADDRHPDQPSDLPPSVEALAATEAQLDAALTGAAVHVDQLQKSVGTPATASDAVERMLDQPGPVSLPDVIDGQLDEIDQLLAETSKQLGADAAEATPADAAKPEAASAAPVAGFMSDLTTPAPGTPIRPVAEAAPLSKQTADAAVPDFMSEFTQTSPTAPATAQPGATVATAGRADRSPAPVPAVKRAPSAEAVPEKNEDTRTAAGPRPLYAVADFLVSMLEVVDRPFRRFTSRTRDVLGWLALIALATAALVFALSLF